MASRLHVFIILSLQIYTSLGLYPVIFVPGDGGSQVEAKLNKTNVVHYICAKKSDWYDLWLNLEQMVPEVIDCWSDNMKLVYNPRTRTTQNNDGVEIRIPGWGNSSTVEYLDPSQGSYSIYFARVASHLLPLGYKRGVNLHGAPYDFRKAANEHEDFFKKLKTLIEETYTSNGNKPVIFICHSMGSPMTLYFLNKQTQAWKDKHVKAMITMAGVWGGTVRALKVYSIGDDLGTYVINSKALMTEQRSNPSLAWLMPSEKLWKPDEVFLQSKNLNVTTKNIQEFYKALNHTDGAMMHDDVKELVKDLEHPGVDLYCLHGTGVPTTEKMVYKTFPGSSPTLIKGDGDGTVNIRSLLACTMWEGHSNGKRFHHKMFPKIDHLQMLRDNRVSEYIKDIVQSITEEEVEEQPPLNRFSHDYHYPTIEIVP